jgi:hypothetical protein
MLAYSATLRCLLNTEFEIRSLFFWCVLPVPRFSSAILAATEYVQYHRTGLLFGK